MKDINRFRWSIASGIAGIYLTVVFALMFQFIGYISYFLFNSILLIVFGVFIKKQKYTHAKITSLILLVSLVASVFFMGSVVPPNGPFLLGEGFLEIVIFGAVLGFPPIPFVGIIPMLIFWIGTIKTLLFLGKRKEINY